MKRIGFFILLMWLVLGRAFGQDRIDWDQIKAAPGSNYIPRSNVSGDGVWTAINAILSGANSVYGTGSPGYIAEWLNDSTLTFDATGAYQLSVGTDAQRPTGAAGLTRYNSTNGNLEYYGASAWEFPVKSSTASGLFTAGSVLFADANGRAAQDNARFKWVDASDYLTVQDASQAVRIGETWTGTGGTEAVFLGYRAGYNASGATYNIGIGTNALRVSASPYNIALGLNSQYNNTSGQYNVALGFSSLYTNQGGSNNFAMGTNALYTLNGGSFNVANGTAALYNVTTGQYNTGVGYQAGYRHTSGSYNTSIGYRTNWSAGTNGILGGSYNVLIGAEAGLENTQAAGAYSIGIGYQALSSASAMTNNIAIGRGAGVSNSNTTVMLLGYGATATANDQITIGSANYTTARFPITGAVTQAAGTTAERPTAVNYMLRGNSDTTGLEGYYNSAWNTLADRGWARSTFVKSSSATVNRLAKFSAANTIVNSNITDDGTKVTITGSEGLILPKWTSSTLPATTEGGKIGYNSTVGQVMLYDGLNSSWRYIPWSSIGIAGGYSDGRVLYGGTSGGIQQDVADALLWGRATQRLGLRGDTSYVLSAGAATDAFWLPRGTTAQRPGTTNTGLLRFNSDSTAFEGYLAAWEILADRDWVRANFSAASAAWTLAGDSGTQTISSGNTAMYTGGWGIVTSAGATDVLTIRGDSTEVATQYDIRGVKDGTGNASPSYGLDWGSYTGAWRLPNGTTAQRPTNAAGLLRWNTSTPGLEIGDGSTWTAIPTGPTLYTGSGSFSGSRAIDFNSNDLTFNEVGYFEAYLDDGSSYMSFGPTNFDVYHDDGTGRNSELTVNKGWVSIVASNGTGSRMDIELDSISFRLQSGVNVDKFKVEADGDIIAIVYDDTKRDSAAHLMGIQESTGKLVPIAAVNAKYFEDTDLTLTAAEIYKFQEVRVFMSTTAGAGSQTELTIPDAAAVYVNTKIVITSSDANGTYNNLVNTPGSTIYEAGNDVSSIVVAAGETIVLWGIRTGASTYRWAVQKN